MKKTSRVVIALILILLGIFAAFYFTLPTLSIHSIKLWTLLAVLLLVCAAVFFPGEVAQFVLKKSAHPASAPRKRFSFAKLFLFAGLGVFFMIFLVSIFSSPFFQAKNYASILDVNLSDIEEYQITLDEVPLMDKYTAALLANRKMGTIVELVSQFEVDESANTQINYQSKPVRVMPLQYSDAIKWFNNRKSGIPGYILVNMKNHEASLVSVEGGINYSPSALFGKNLMRHVWLNDPFELYGDYSFEIDDNGDPVWIVQELTKRIGLFHGDDLKGVAVVNAITGEINRYPVGQIPAWIDGAYSAGMVLQQYDWYGVFQNGFFNSVFGQRNVVKTTQGYNYIAFDDDIYLYSGVTSVVGDESNIGFIFTNMRTKETVQYNYASAEEYSAMDSAKGQVQHLGYDASFPILVRVNGELTYCMALKDAAGLVKMYSMVNAAQYQVVVSEANLQATKLAYANALGAIGISPDPDILPDDALSSVLGNVTKLQQAVIDGNTYIIFALEGQDMLFSFPVKKNPHALFLTAGTEVRAFFLPSEETVQSVNVEKLDISAPSIPPEEETPPPAEDDTQTDDTDTVPSIDGQTSDAVQTGNTEDASTLIA